MISKATRSYKKSVDGIIPFSNSNLSLASVKPSKYAFCFQLSSSTGISTVSPFLQMVYRPSSPVSSMGVVNTVVPSRGKRFEHHFLNKWMYRDYKRRCLVKQHFPARQRMNAMKRCSILPKEFQVGLIVPFY